MPEPAPLEMGKRERQIVEAVYRLGEASVAEVRSAISEPPSYSAVRAMLNILVGKRVLTSRQDGRRYVYRPVKSKEKVRRSALRSLVRTFFGGAPVDAVAALLEESAGSLTADDLQRIKRLIEDAEREQRP